MKRMTAVTMAYALLFAAQISYAGMMDHMKDHMGGGMGDSMQGTEKKDDENGAKGAWHVKEAEEADVKVKVTYKNPGKSKGPVFDVVLDTHSVDLDRYKLEEITVLRDDTGNEYNAGLASSSGSGHHREGVLEFKDADISTAKSVELVVKGVAGVDERVFRFELQR